MSEDRMDKGHIAVLVADTAIEGITDKYGDFGDNCISLVEGSGVCKFGCKKYQVALCGSSDEGGGSFSSFGGNIKSLEDLKKVYHELKHQLDEGNIRGVLITGSRSDAWDQSIGWIRYLDDFIQRELFSRDQFPIVGICFGHQIIAKNLGCKVGKNAADIGWEVGTTTISLNKDILGVENTPFADVLVNEDGTILEHLNLLEFHQDIVYGLPPPSILEKKRTKIHSIGSTSKCSIQGLVTEHGPLKIFTVQGHPEFTSQQTIDMLDRMHKTGAIDEKLIEKSKYNTRILNNQGHLVGKAIAIFLSSFE